jgi:hypothetical protein
MGGYLLLQVANFYLDCKDKEKVRLENEALDNNSTDSDIVFQRRENLEDLELQQVKETNPGDLSEGQSEGVNNFTDAIPEVVLEPLTSLLDVAPNVISSTAAAVALCCPETSTFIPLTQIAMTALYEVPHQAYFLLLKLYSQDYLYNFKLTLSKPTVRTEKYCENSEIPDNNVKLNKKAEAKAKVTEC